MVAESPYTNYMRSLISKAGHSISIIQLQQNFMDTICRSRSGGGMESLHNYNSLYLLLLYVSVSVATWNCLYSCHCKVFITHEINLTSLQIILA